MFLMNVWVGRVYGSRFVIVEVSRLEYVVLLGLSSVFWFVIVDRF